MNLKGKNLIHVLAIAVIALLIAPVQAQTNEAASESKQKPADEMGQLKSKVEQLQSLIEQQQHMLAELQKRIDDMQSRTPAPASARVDVTNTAGKVAIETRQKSDAATPSQNQKAQDKTEGVAGWGSRAFIRSADGSFETQIGGYAQLDHRTYQSGDVLPNTFLVRRARIALEGKLEKYFEFRVEGDLADVAGTALRDFYINIHRIDEVQFRFGQFRVPISQEEMRSDNLQDFVERSMVNNLVPSRSPGLMVSGSIKKGVFEYQVGAFNGKGLLLPNTSDTPESAVRLRFNPWKNTDSFWTKGFIFGGAFTQGRNGSGLSVRGQTESRSFIFFVPDTVNGKYIRANGELTWLLGPAAFRAEYDQTNQSRENLGAAGANLPGVVAKGYTTQFTYLLTGENKPEAGVVVPRRDIFSTEGGKRGFGAWELKFRYANLQISDATERSNRAESFYFGPNWYLNRFVRYLFDFGIERFKNPTRTPQPGDRNFLVILNRVQVSF